MGVQCSGITFPSQGKGLGFESRHIQFFSVRENLSNSNTNSTDAILFDDVCKSIIKAILAYSYIFVLYMNQVEGNNLLIDIK